VQAARVKIVSQDRIWYPCSVEQLQDLAGEVEAWSRGSISRGTTIDTGVGDDIDIMPRL
jgi:hypothetical protein